MTCDICCDCLTLSHASQLDTGRATLDVLVECVEALKQAGLSELIEVYVDGG